MKHTFYHLAPLALWGLGCFLLVYAGPAGATQPTPISQDIATLPNTPRTITLTASHPEGGPLTFTVTSNPSHGTLAGTPPTLTYTPAQGFWGTDEFTFNVTDSGGDTSWMAPVTIDVAVVIDNDSPAGVIITGAWTRNSPGWGYYWGASYLHDNNTGKGPGKYVTFAPNIPQEGMYDVHIWYPDYGTSAASNVPVDITHGSLTGAAVTDTISVDQRYFGGGWKYLGQYIFNATPGQAKATIRTDGTTGGYVTADTFKFLYRKPLPSSTPAAPSGLAAQVNWRNVRLTWNDNATDEDGFTVEQSTDNVDFSEIADKPVDISAHITDPLALGTTYYFRVRAHNVRGASGYSNVVTITTPTLGLEVIPPERSIDWSQAGIPGGIPNRTTKCATAQCIALETTGAGGSDDLGLIQAAIDSASAGQYVRIPAGTYTINGSINISKDSVTVRGDGPGATILDSYGSGTGVIRFGSGAPGDLVWGTTTRALNVLSGATKGSTSITLSSTTGITVGGLIQIDQLNDPGFVTIEGNEGTCSWCSRYSGARALGQIMEVTAINGTTVSIQPALYWTYSSNLSPQVLPFSAGRKNSGVEYLTVRSNTGFTTNFYLSGAAYCWLKGVEGDYTDGDHVQFISSFRCEVRDSYFHDAFHHTPGQTDQDLFIAGKSSGILVENNIFWRLHCSIMFDWGSSGNVIAYNYSDGTFDQRAPNVLMGDMSVHGSHPMFNLWEGNIIESLHPDGTWGSSSHSTAFRNWVRNTTKIYNPLIGRGPVDFANGWWAVQANRAIVMDFASLYYNIVGNVVGSDEMTNLKIYNGSTPMGQQTFVIWPAPRLYDSVAYNFSFGYGGSGTNACGANPCNDHAYITALLHGNYDSVSKSILWDSSIADHALPASLYLGSKPSWFGTYQWPPFDPNDPLLSDPSAYSSALHLPAQGCFQEAIKPGGSFDPAACYAGGTGGALYGDVSENGTISAYDASLTAQYAAGLITLTQQQITKAEVSGNGTVSAYDASLIAQRAAGLIDKFPVEP